MKQDLLKKFLVGYPAKINYEIKDNDQFKRNLFKAFFYAVTNDGEYLDVLFPNISHVEMMELSEYEFDLDDQSRMPFYMSVSDEEFTHPKGVVCARPLKQGEPVYRCDDCGMDSTCVLCVHCYNPAAHNGHDVQMYISSSDGNGICDCGDPEAFKGDLDCKCQKLLPVSEGLAPEFQSSLKITLRTLLDYVLDVTNFSVTTLPFIHDNINSGDNLLQSETISNMSSLPANKYGIEDINSPNIWYLVLWNDEYHNFVEAIDAISAAIKVDHMRAHEIASDVNINGRCILKVGSSPIGLFTALDAAESNGLVASIVSARDYIREEIVHQTIAWMLSVSNFTSHFGFRAMVRSTIAELLLETNHTFTKFLPSTLLDSLSINVSRRCFENSLLLNGRIVNYGFSELHDASVQDLTKPASQVLQLPKEDFLNSRIQFLMLFSIRFKTSVRKILSQLIIPPVVSSQSLKAKFCQQYIQIYPQLVTATALSDREDHLNLLSDVSSQIMTCPTSVQWILESGSIGHVLGPMAQLIEEHASKWNYDSGYPNFFERVTDDRIGKERSIYEAIYRALHDLTYVTDPNFSQDASKNLLKRDNFGLLILVLRTFQDYWPISRKYGDHVEREVLDFVIHLRYSMPILKITKQIAEYKCDDPSVVTSVVKYLMNYLLLRKIDQKALGIANFRVSKEPVSFVHPLNSFLSYIIQNHKFELFVPIFQGINKPFMNISDISLRSIVLASQVRIGFWIRNGISVSKQASLYLDTALVDFAYKRDMHLQQLALLFDDPGTTLYNFLDRWELFEWFTNDVTFDKTIYEDRFGTLVERFVIFLYNLFTDRTAFISMSDTERNEINTKNLIIYSLSSGPKPYSDIKDYIDNELTDDSNFDNWLLECADYQPPTSMIDSGMYRLKPALYLELDPYSVYLDPSQSQEVIDAIAKQKAKLETVSEKDVDIAPKLILATDFVNKNIGKFTTTTYFAKMVYKLLQVALDSGEETYIGPLLHLLHAALIDFELVSETHKIPANLVDIPISDLLLNIAESSMTKMYVSKAERLLNYFIANDGRVMEGLLDCFGKEHVDMFLNRRDGITESEDERKKRIASERNAKVMKKFAKQRKKFLAKNDDLSTQLDEEVESRNIKGRNCVLCGEVETTNSTFGILGSVLSPSIFWKLPVNDRQMYISCFSNNSFNQFYRDDQDETRGYHYSRYGKSDDPDYVGLYPKDSQDYERDIVYSCGHGMHYECYKQSTGRAKHYSCPLCHTIQNIFIPSFLPSTTSKSLGDLLDGPQINDSYSKVLHSDCVNKSRTLVTHFLNEEYTNMALENARKTFEVYYKDFNPKFKTTAFLKGATPKVSYFNLLQTLLATIADTIRMHEITSRLRLSSSSESKFVNTLSGSNKSLLKSLFQTRALLFELKHLPIFLGTNCDLSEEIERFWQSEYLILDVFTEVVVLFFQTDESFTTLAKLGMIKLFTICLHSFLMRTNHNGSFLQSLNSIPAVENDTLQPVVDFLCSYIYHESNEVLLRLFPYIYGVIIQCMAPFIRQMIIFKDLLTSTDVGDNVHISLPELEKVTNDDVLGGFYTEEELDHLCGVLELPTLSSLVKSLLDETSMEYRTFDVIAAAKIPKYFESGVLALEYPGTIKLIDLPNNYKDCLSHLQTIKKGTYDNYICLHCGLHFPIKAFQKHMRKCSHNTCIFFHPSKNTLRVVTHIGAGAVSLLLPGPYLTIHGEVKEARNTSNAYLNEFRYNELTKQWLNQELYAFVTRTLYGSRQTQETNTNNMAVDEESSDEDEEFRIPNFFNV